LPDVGDLLLVDRLKSCDLALRILELLTVLGCSVTNSGDKPIGRGPDGGTDLWIESEEWVESEDACSRSWRDQGVVFPLEFNEVGDFFFFGCFLNAGNKGEWEGGRDRRRRDFLNGGLFWGQGDIWRVRWRPA